MSSTDITIPNTAVAALFFAYKAVPIASTLSGFKAIEPTWFLLLTRSVPYLLPLTVGDWLTQLRGCVAEFQPRQQKSLWLVLLYYWRRTLLPPIPLRPQRTGVPLEVF